MNDTKHGERNNGTFSGRSPRLAAGVMALTFLTSAAAQETSPADARAHPRPRTAERQAERDEMVQRQIAARGITDAAVLEAMRHVPRHEFVPERLQRDAYADRPLPIGHDQTISQPYIVALMTDLLDLTPESKVLEIGTGSGYQAAVLAEITPRVYSIEIVEPLAERAAKAFERLGYTTIKVKAGDGYRGWPEHAPFDAIILTCAPDHTPPALIEQLAPGGRMCLPVGDGIFSQELIVITKDDAGKTSTRTVAPVRFVPMTGEARDKKE